jgi:hypothetical protein
MATVDACQRHDSRECGGRCGGSGQGSGQRCSCHGGHICVATRGVAGCRCSSGSGGQAGSRRGSCDLLGHQSIRSRDRHCCGRCGSSRGRGGLRRHLLCALC